MFSSMRCFFPTGNPTVSGNLGEHSIFFATLNVNLDDLSHGIHKPQIAVKLGEDTIYHHIYIFNYRRLSLSLGSTPSNLPSNHR